MPSISRRDFLNGVALTVAAGLTPAAQIAAEPLRYPPALTGLRGQHAGSFETAHAQAREGKHFALDRLPVEQRYDIVTFALLLLFRPDANRFVERLTTLWCALLAVLFVYGIREMLFMI